jgi:hypothetical protein
MSRYLEKAIELSFIYFHEFFRFDFILKKINRQKVKTAKMKDIKGI